MANYTVRIELHKAESEDYEALHEYMTAEGFTNQIQSTTSGNKKTYYLPPAEYNMVTNLTADQVFDKAKAASSKTGLKFAVLQTSGVRKWIGLEEV